MRRRSSWFARCAILTGLISTGIQIVKGWLDADGTAQERIYEVAWAGDRALDAEGKLPPVGDTVDVAKASYENSIGAALLAGYWEDPDFDPSLRAFYYVRVLEIPTPSWIAYDEKFFGTRAPEEAVRVQQERA